MEDLKTKKTVSPEEFYFIAGLAVNCLGISLDWLTDYNGKKLRSEEIQRKFDCSKIVIASLAALTKNHEYDGINVFNFIGLIQDFITFIFSPLHARLFIFGFESAKFICLSGNNPKHLARLPLELKTCVKADSIDIVESLILKGIYKLGNNIDADSLCNVLVTLFGAVHGGRELIDIQ